MTENAGLGLTVTFVKATDRDSGLNGLVKYSFISPGNAPFTVDESTGEVRVSGVVDFEITEVCKEMRKGPFKKKVAFVNVVFGFPPASQIRPFPHIS